MGWNAIVNGKGSTTPSLQAPHANGRFSISQLIGKLLRADKLQESSTHPYGTAIACAAASQWTVRVIVNDCTVLPDALARICTGGVPVGVVGAAGGVGEA